MNRKQQKGIVLVISLVLMVVITLFVLSSTRLATGNLRIIGNIQAKKAAEAVALQRVEDVLARVQWFSPGYNTTVPVTTPLPSGVTATVDDRVCLRSNKVTGTGEGSGVPLYDTLWNVRVTVNDSITNAQSVVNQGVKIRVLTTTCPL